VIVLVTRRSEAPGIFAAQSAFASMYASGRGAGQSDRIERGNGAHADEYVLIDGCHRSLLRDPPPTGRRSCRCRRRTACHR